MSVNWYLLQTVHDDQTCSHDVSCCISMYQSQLRIWRLLLNAAHLLGVNLQTDVSLQQLLSSCWQASGVKGETVKPSGTPQYVALLGRGL